MLTVPGRIGHKSVFSLYVRPNMFCFVSGLLHEPYFLLTEFSGSKGTSTTTVIEGNIFIISCAPKVSRA